MHNNINDRGVAEAPPLGPHLNRACKMAEPVNKRMKVIVSDTFEVINIITIIILLLLFQRPLFNPTEHGLDGNFRLTSFTKVSRPPWH